MVPLCLMGQLVGVVVDPCLPVGAEVLHPYILEAPLACEGVRT